LFFTRYYHRPKNVIENELIKCLLLNNIFLIHIVKFNSISPHIVSSLQTIVGIQHVLLDEESLVKHGHDEVDNVLSKPEVVVKPRTAAEISAILQLANEHLIPVTARGGGTGLSGGALPLYSGIVISTERFNEIIEIDERNQQAIVEPGVINEVFQNAVKEVNLFYPPDPSSKGSCFLGGNIAENAGGPKCVKYGTTKDYVLSLEVVLPTGEIINTGAHTLKNSTGYNLTQLMIGSEGTLGIVTRIVLRLIPLPKYDLLMLVPFKSMEECCQLVSDVFSAGFTPSAMELMERDAIVLTSEYIDNHTITIEPDDEAHLLIEVDGNNLDVLNTEMEAIAQLVANYKTGDILFADSAAQKNELFKLRRKINEAVRARHISKEQDTVVPRAELPSLVKGVKEIGARYNFKSVCYGHAGDGNLHIRFLQGEIPDEQWHGQYIKDAIIELFTLCKQLKGTISGEHGIGWVQQEYIRIVFSETEIALQKNIKALFDPKGILNPGKMFGK
jgi:glycolate oxidase